MLQGSGMSGNDLALVTRAYSVAAEAHGGVARKSGEPYITHPVAVATILAEMQVDAETLAAVAPRCARGYDVTLDDIRTQFGDRVASGW